MHRVTEGIVLVLVSLIAIWGAWQVPAAISENETWAGIVPFSAAVALLVLSAIVLLDGVRATGGNDEMSGAAVLDILILFVVALIYQQSFRWFGYLLPTAVVAPIALYSFGVRNPLGLALSVVLCPLIYHVLFFELLGVFPPFGEVFDLFDLIRG